MNDLTKLEKFAIQILPSVIQAEMSVTGNLILEYLELPIDTKYDYKKHWFQYCSRLAIDHAKSLIEELDGISEILRLRKQISNLENEIENLKEKIYLYQNLI